MPEPVLTLKEAADYLRVPLPPLYTQRHRGDRPGALGIRVGRKILYRPSAMNRFLNDRLAETHISQTNKTRTADPCQGRRTLAGPIP